MIYYTLYIFLSLSLITLLCDSRSSAYHHLFKWIIFIFFIFFIGFRSDVGDYKNYLLLYQAVDDSQIFKLWHIDILRDQIEFGYYYLMVLFKYLSAEFFLFSLFITSLSLIIKFNVFQKYSSNFFLSILAWFATGLYWGDMSAMRMGLAVSLIMLSYTYIYRQNLIKYLFILSVAASIHVISLVAIPLYFINYIKGKSILLFIFLVSNLLAIYNNIGREVADLFIQIFKSDNSISILLARYLQSPQNEGFSLFGGTYLLYFLPAIFALIFYDRLILLNKYNSFLIKLLVVSTSFVFVSIDFGIVSDRIKDAILIPVLCLVLPSFLLIFKQRIIPFFVIMLYLSVFFIFFGNKSDLTYSNFLYL